MTEHEAALGSKRGVTVRFTKVEALAVAYALRTWEASDVTTKTEMRAITTALAKVERATP